MQSVKALHQRHEGCHGLILGWQFTVKGREAYSDSMFQVLKEKYPHIPIVLLGKIKMLL